MNEPKKIIFYTSSAFLTFFLNIESNMCHCEVLSKFDNCIVSLRTKILIFCWWTLIHGLVFAPGSYWVYFGKLLQTLCNITRTPLNKVNLFIKRIDMSRNDPLRPYMSLCFLVSVIEFIAGILLLLAVKCVSDDFHFELKKIFSFFLFRI